jgi:hypothetical protein
MKLPASTSQSVHGCSKTMQGKCSVDPNINAGIHKFFEPTKQILFWVGAVISTMGCGFVT